MAVDLAGHERLLEELRTKWPNSVLDGAVNGQRYLAARPRILWILREVIGGEAWDLRELLRTDDVLFRVAPRWPSTYGAVAKVSHGLLNNLPADGSWIDEPARMRVDALRQIAVINLKKVSGGSGVDWRSFGRERVQFSEIVDEQVGLLDPEVIIAGGTFEDLSARVRARGVVRAYHPMQLRIKQREYYRGVHGQLLRLGPRSGSGTRLSS